VVVWVDNWYWQRYRPDPADANISLDLSVMAVLPLTTTTDTPALHTRSHTFDPFPGHSSLERMRSRVEVIDSTCRLSLGRLMQKVRQLTANPIEASAIRVPLDIHRPRRRRLQWRALALSQMRVGAAPELIRVLEDVRTLQRHVGRVLPLLVDEKVHYSTMRLLYAPAHWSLDVHGWLRQVPVIYGSWHPYKHTLTLLYRWFLPVFTALELRQPPPVGSTFKASRKVVFMEKMVAGLLLAAHTVRAEVSRALAAAATPSNRKVL
jgi:hypothetical protein